MPRPKRTPHLRLKRRGSGRALWIIRDGARDIGTGCDEADRAGAEGALRAHLAAQWEPPKSNRHPDRLLIVEALAAYIKHHAPHTARPDVRFYTAQSVARHAGTATVSAVTGQWCRQYVQARMAEGVKSATARHDLTTLRAALRWFHAEYGMDGASPPTVTLPARSPGRQRWLTRDEVAAMLWAARATGNTHVARLILLGIYSGTRPGALLRLRWMPSTVGGHIDLEAGILHRRPIERSEQARKRQPPQRLHTSLVPHLARWRAHDLDAGIPVVIHYAGDPVQKLRRSWATVRARAGLGPDVVPHTLRHTAATWQMLEGRDIYEAAGWLGMTHQTLWDVYGHHHPAFQGAVTGRFSRR